MKINTLHKIAFTAFGLVLGAVSVSAQEATYGPYDGSQKRSYFGTGKKENYDVAIHLTNSALVGKTVKGIVIPMNSDITGIDSTAVAFMSKTLTIKNKVNRQHFRRKGYYKVQTALHHHLRRSICGLFAVA